MTYFLITLPLLGVYDKYMKLYMFTCRC